MHNNNSTPELPFRYFRYLILADGISNEFRDFNDKFIELKNMNDSDLYFDQETLTYHEVDLHDENGILYSITTNFNEELGKKLHKELIIANENIIINLLAINPESIGIYYKSLCIQINRFNEVLAKRIATIELYQKSTCISEALKTLTFLLDTYVLPLIVKNEAEFNNSMKSTIKIKEDGYKNPIIIQDKKKLNSVLSKLKKHMPNASTLLAILNSSEHISNPKLQWTITNGRKGNGSIFILYLFLNLQKEIISKIKDVNLYDFISNNFLDADGVEFTKEKLKAAHSPFKRDLKSKRYKRSGTLKNIDDCFS